MGVRKDIVADRAKILIQQVRDESNNATTLKAVLELINTIFIYKFPDLTRQEIEAMLGISELKQTRVYQDAQQEARQNEKLEIISRMVPLGLTVEQIAQSVNMTVEEVHRVIAQLPSNSP
jgi:predicted transposase/invertase (TIGR01784 family)